MPAVSICTDAFRAPAEAMARVYGFPNFEFALIPHPIASLDASQIEANVNNMIGEVERILGVRE